VKQLRKHRAELARQYEAHLLVCRHASAQGPSQSADLPDSQTVLSDALPQYAVYTSGHQQFISPVMLLSSDSTTPSTPVQLVTIAPSENNFTECVDVHLTNSSSSVEHKSDNVTSESSMSNGIAAFGSDEKDKTLNGVCMPTSVNCDGVSEALLTAVDEHSKNCKAAVVDGQNSIGDGTSSVLASPISKPKYNTHRRRSLSSVIRRTSEPALRASKRSSARHLSSDEPLTKKAARENSDSLPLFLSAMTDE